ncbi:unnamed protein product [Somion occarium]|uniref:Uncharacterized protein n=1 Tax=Somion occarium TaxID=3059160 RepID=A0ABP1CVW8_9APHY
MSADNQGLPIGGGALFNPHPHPHHLPLSYHHGNDKHDDDRYIVKIHNQIEVGRPNDNHDRRGYQGYHHGGSEGIGGPGLGLPRIGDGAGIGGGGFGKGVGLAEPDIGGGISGPGVDSVEIGQGFHHGLGQSIGTSTSQVSAIALSRWGGVGPVKKDNKLADLTKQLERITLEEGEKAAEILHLRKKKELLIALFRASVTHSQLEVLVKESGESDKTRANVAGGNSSSATRENKDDDGAASSGAEKEDGDE